MARICRWIVEEKGCVLYDWDTGEELTVFIDNEFSGPEVGDEIYCEWNEANICWKYDQYPDMSVKSKTYRTGFNGIGMKSGIN